MRVLTTALALSASMASAECPAGQDVFMSCQIEGRQTVLSVCLGPELATYSYGPKGGPAELTLSEPLTSLEYTPWPGVGRAIWEEVAFTNGPYRYTVSAGFDRMFGDETEADHPTPYFGGVIVQRDDAVLAELTCDRRLTNFGAFGGDPIYEAKTAAGQEWDSREGVWRDGSE